MNIFQWNGMQSMCQNLTENSKKWETHTHTYAYREREREYELKDITYRRCLNNWCLGKSIFIAKIQPTMAMKEFLKEKPVQVRCYIRKLHYNDFR